MRNALIASAAMLAVAPGAALAAGKTPAPDYTLTSTTYTQNFDGLATTGTSRVLPAGFQIVENGTGSAADGLYAAGTGSGNAGNSYSFGAAGSTDRALGSLSSDSVGPIWFGGVFTNGLALAITSLAFAYTGEQWRSGSAAADGLTFQYSLDATQIDNGTWSAMPGLNFTAAGNINGGAINGNVFATDITGTIDTAIASGQRFGFRWVDADATGSDHGLAIDNLTITATLAGAGAVPEPSSWALLIVGFGAVGAAQRRRPSRLALA